MVKNVIVVHINLLVHSYSKLLVLMLKFKRAKPCMLVFISYVSS